MKKAYVAASMVLPIVLGMLMLGWSPAWNEKPRIPMAGLSSQGLGHCVALYEDDALIGITKVPFLNMRDADLNRSMFAISTYNAIGVIAQAAGRPDLASRAVELRLTDGPNPNQEIGTTECYCTNTTYSGDPRRGGTITGCGGPCGNCERCVVKQKQVQ